MTRVTQIDETVTIGGDLTVGRIGYGAMQLTGPRVWGDYPDHDGGVAHEQAGEGDQLLFARRQHGLMVTEPGVEAGRQVVEPVGEAELLEGVPHPLVADGAVEQGDVVAQGGAQQLDPLRHHPHVSTQLATVDGAHVDPVEEHMARRG